VPGYTNLEKLIRETAPEIPMDPIAVIGADYWPLPWYLRSFEKIGYWPTPPEDLGTHALVIAMPETTAAVMALLADSHVPLPRGLRAGVPIYLFVRNDVWKLWMNHEQP